MHANGFAFSRPMPAIEARSYPPRYRPRSRRRLGLRSLHPPAPLGISWAALLARVFALDVTRCPVCGGHLRLIAALTDPRIHSALSARRRATDPAPAA